MATKIALKGRDMWRYTEILSYSSEWEYRRYISIDTGFQQQQIIQLGHFMPTNKKLKYILYSNVQCIYNQLRSKYLPDIINVRHPRKHLIILMNSSSRETKSLNFAKFLVCAFNLRSSMLDANTWVSPYVDFHRAALQTYVLMCTLYTI